MATNTVTIIGNVTRDPELRFTPSGQAVANFGVAVNRRWQNRQTNEWEEATSFFDIVAWAKLGENVSESCPKGTRVIVTGRLDQRSWDGPDGDRRSKVEIVADEVAPSLRWASAEITKNEKRGPGEGGPGGGGGGTAAAPPPSAPPAGYNYDEEPF
ncbi:MAG: single-stranded DNA-binding protein [Microthrixaceae bacterium]|nr:single-stranded DNA-binding protein [Microthrixaceae bacterium]